MSTAADLATVTAALVAATQAETTAANALIAAYQAAQSNPGPVTQAQLDAAVSSLQGALSAEQAATTSLTNAVTPPPTGS
jgi:hypothetical protein